MSHLRFLAERIYRREKRRYLKTPTARTTTRKPTAMVANHWEPFLIFLGQRGKRQNMMTTRQIAPPRIQ